MKPSLKIFKMNTKRHSEHWTYNLKHWQLVHMNHHKVHKYRWLAIVRQQIIISLRNVWIESFEVQRWKSPRMTLIKWESSIRFQFSRKIGFIPSIRHPSPLHFLVTVQFCATAHWSASNFNWKESALIEFKRNATSSMQSTKCRWHINIPY